MKYASSLMSWGIYRGEGVMGELQFTLRRINIRGGKNADRKSESVRTRGKGRGKNQNVYIE